MAVKSRTSKTKLKIRQDKTGKSLFKSQNKLPLSVRAARSFARTITTPARNLRSRRPHKSFVKTRRRDYVRPLDLPGYIQFTHKVNTVFRANIRLFLSGIVVFSAMYMLFGGLSSASTYNALSEGMSVFEESIPGFVRSGTLVVAAVTGGTTDGAQQLYIAIITLMVWLTFVWLLRELFAGRHPRFRDGLYNAGSPIISTVFNLFKATL